MGRFLQRMYESDGSFNCGMRLLLLIGQLWVGVWDSKICLVLSVDWLFILQQELISSYYYWFNVIGWRKQNYKGIMGRCFHMGWISITRLLYHLFAKWQGKEWLFYINLVLIWLSSYYKGLWIIYFKKQAVVRGFGCSNKKETKSGVVLFEIMWVDLNFNWWF